MHGSVNQNQKHEVGVSLIRLALLICKGMNSKENAKKIEEMISKEATLEAEIAEDNQKLADTRHPVVHYTR